MSREVELGSEIWRCENELGMLQEQVDTLKDEKRGAEEDLMALLIEEGKNSTGHIEGVGEFKLARKVYPSVNKANMPIFIDFLKRGPDSSLVKETVEAKTLQAYCKTKIEELALTFQDEETRRVALDETDSEDGITDFNLAAKVWAKHGVAIFDEVKLSHTKKGK
jgi:hypothetical protein